MRTSGPPVLFSLIGVVLIWPYVLTKSISPRLQPTESSSQTRGQEEKHPLMTKRSVTNCESQFDNFCFNNGQCMLLVDLNAHHCKCESGFYGPRCDKVDLVSQPMKIKEQVVVILFCVSLLMIGLGGALYFFYKWYKKNKFQRQPKSQSYKGVQKV